MEPFIGEILRMKGSSRWKKSWEKSIAAFMGVLSNNLFHSLSLFLLVNFFVCYEI